MCIMLHSPTCSKTVFFFQYHYSLRLKRALPNIGGPVSCSAPFIKALEGRGGGLGLRAIPNPPPPPPTPPTPIPPSMPVDIITAYARLVRVRDYPSRALNFARLQNQYFRIPKKNKKKTDRTCIEDEIRD